MSRMRRIIADRLTQSFRDIPHFFVTVGADMTDLMAYRKELKAAGRSYSLNDFVMKSVILALEEHGDVNSMTPDGRSIVRHPQVHLGLAVSIEQGLVVPVIRNAGALDMDALHEQARERAGRARDGKLTPEEMQGGTFTISNMGMLGVEQFNAIINPGEGAILAVASVQDTPAVREGELTVRKQMKMTLSADHRIVDGATGAQFLNAVKDKLEDVEFWKQLVG
ncbi:Dihydrolipoyllysine-residue acetyltransferase component of pyruvate dehydrogenase complex [Kiritimatiella glycovorans]|uniref:Dihydrolipoyllysine-residue acetyltransferase component of pyruvate dehydrogenase complex n=2 Tax=Kiritimatiella glycovorans TaxID=1307763 RepID=A0A0G3EIN5_9BACT|nr:dihydrolipoamide acetyltransferase family protein [Kiritimatiella glycovorans]AKJ64680.1 Dihydrolipoyllysine-residue acetyltransferase component of pyruvate dehydrogenase complex [Kiritimatiella glycovorans]